MLATDRANPRIKLSVSLLVNARRLNGLAVEVAIAIKADFAVHHLTRPRSFASGK